MCFFIEFFCCKMAKILCRDLKYENDTHTSLIWAHRLHATLREHKKCEISVVNTYLSLLFFKKVIDGRQHFFTQKIIILATLINKYPLSFLFTIMELVLPHLRCYFYMI